MALIPTQVVPVIRAALVSQGFPARTIGDDGSVDPVQLFSGAYSTIEFRSQITPTITVRVSELSGKPSAIPGLIRPAIIFTGKAGKAVVAPEGMPANIGGLVAAGIVIGLIGLGFMLGRMGK